MKNPFKRFVITKKEDQIIGQANNVKKANHLLHKHMATNGLGEEDVAEYSDGTVLKETTFGTKYETVEFPPTGGQTTDTEYQKLFNKQYKAQSNLPE